RLVRAALWAERDPGRGGDEDRLTAGVHPERPLLERARDERVVDGADRKQRLAVPRPRRAGPREPAGGVALRDAQLDVAGRRPCDVSRQRSSVLGSSANQSMRSPTFQTPTLLIQPPRFVDDATSGLTVTMRSATAGTDRAMSASRRPNCCCVESEPVASPPSS